jgi:hypothetical protein
MRAFADRLNDALLLPSAPHDHDLLAVRNHLVARGADLEGGAVFEAYAVYASKK